MGELDEALRKKIRKRLLANTGVFSVDILTSMKRDF